MHTSDVRLSSSLLRELAEVWLILSKNTHKRSVSTVFFSSMYPLLGSSESYLVIGQANTSSGTRQLRLE